MNIIKRTSLLIKIPVVRFFFLSGKFSFNSSNLFIKYAFEIAKADAVHLNVFRKILVRRNVMKKWDLRKER